MKTKNLAKILVLALSLVLLMTAVIGITASAEGEDVVDDRGNIYSTSIVHNDKISIAIAVKATAEEIANNTVTVKYQWADEAEPKTATYFGTHENQEGYVWVVTEGVAAYDLAREATITSYLNEGLVESGKYSVATFLYNKLYIDGVTGAAQECYETLLEYGATSQVYLDKNPGAPVNALNYAYTKNADVKINGSSSAFGSNVTLDYIGDQILEGWVVDGVTYPASQTTFEINGTCSVDVICTEKIKVNITIGEFANGTVTADKDSYNVGDTVTLTITPESGYFQKLYINDEPLMLGWKTFTYSFTATENAYEITGSFEKGISLTPSDAGRWDDHNQAHGVLNTYYPNNGDSWWMDINGEYQSVEITAKNLVPKADSMDGNGQNGYMQIIRFGLSNGNTYAFRIYNDKGTYAVSCTAVSGSSSGWGNWKNVANVLGYSIDDAMSGDGVQFKVERTSADTMTVSVNGVVMFTYTMDGVTEADTVTFVGIQSNANSGKYVEIPFTLTVPEVEEEPPVSEGDEITLTIGEFANGTVTADKDSYNVGDTVTLTVSPDDGYAQKLYINDEAILVDTNSMYSFVVEEGKTYNITGEFVSVIGFNPSDETRWNTINQAHGVINTKYNASHNNESWWMDINGEYDSFAFTAKNYLSVEDSCDGSGNVFRIVIRMTFDNGTNYAFTVWIDSQQRYCYNRCDYSGSSSGSSGAWRNINEQDPTAVNLFNTTGAEFKIERVSGNQLKLTVNGTEMETFTMSAISEENKVVSVGMRLYGNPDQDIEIPFELN